MTTTTTSTVKANDAAETTVAVTQKTSSKLGRITRTALIAVAVAGAIGGAYYFLTKAKAIVEDAGETTEAEETPAV